MERFYQEQLERIDRLMKVIEADDQQAETGGLLFYDMLIFTCQSMWHLKDWILNDPHFGAKDLPALKAEIHSTSCLLVCSDIANGTKHLSLGRPKVGGQLSDRTGLQIDTTKGIFRESYYVICSDPKDVHNGMEIRVLLRLCRDAWENIVNRHYLSEADVLLAQQSLPPDSADGSVG